MYNTNYCYQHQAVFSGSCNPITIIIIFIINYSSYECIIIVYYDLHNTCTS